MNTALFDLIEQNKIDPDKVKQLRVALSQTVFDLHGKLAHYKAKFDALISAHYTAAIILHDQELTLAQFEPRATTIRSCARPRPSRSRCVRMPR